MNDLHPLIDELQAAIKSRSTRQKNAACKRLADYFVVGSRRYTDDQITLFDDVFQRLIADIEVKTLVKLAHCLAPLPDAPPKTIRSLAFNDEIEVAAPVLASSPQLTTSDLVENASTKSQAHLLAIAQRPQLSEAVTDVLVDRGDRRVVRSVAKNEGARFSDVGFGKLVVRARDDDTLARNLGTRHDIPRHHFLKLLASASASVRSRLEAAIPDASKMIQDAVADIADNMSRESREASREHAKVKKHAKLCYSMREFNEANVHAPASTQDFERTVVALALYGRFPVDLVERALVDEGTDMILVLGRAAGLSRATVKALLLMNAGGRGLSEQDLDDTLASFDRLRDKTAKRVLEFYEKRRKAVEKAAGRMAQGAETTAPRQAEIEVELARASGL